MTGDNVVDSATGLTWERSFGDLTDYPTGESECAAWGRAIAREPFARSRAPSRSIPITAGPGRCSTGSRGRRRKRSQNQCKREHSLFERGGA
jgi:hypothetical protein